MRRLTMILAASAVFASAAATASAQMDLSKLPPTPAEMHEKLSGAASSLAECVEIAEEETGGVASDATRLEIEPSIVIVTVYTTQSRHSVHVDSRTGEVVAKETAQRFPGFAIPEGVDMQETDSGLMYFVLEEGDGPSPSGSNATVEVNYAGYLVDGTKFDSSYDRGQTIQFPLNRVISGWTEGVGMMKAGGKRKLVIPAELGYGARGAGGTIPPNAMLVFDVELVSVVRDPDAESGGADGGGE